jgi:hypothetical protein
VELIQQLQDQQVLPVRSDQQDQQVHKDLLESMVLLEPPVQLEQPEQPVLLESMEQLDLSEQLALSELVAQLVLKVFKEFKVMLVRPDLLVQQDPQV